MLDHIAHSSAAEVAAAPPSPVPLAPRSAPRGGRLGGLALESVAGAFPRAADAVAISPVEAWRGYYFLDRKATSENFRGGLRETRHFRRAGTRGAGLGRGERPRPGQRQRRSVAGPVTPPSSAAGGCASAPGLAPERPGRPSPPCAPGGGGAPLPLGPWRGAAGRATRPSSCRRPSVPCSSPAGRSSATRSASSAASAAWPRKPASARSGPPRYRPPWGLRPGGPRGAPGALSAAGPSVAERRT